MMPAYLSIDVGTSAAKLTLYTGDGRLLGSRSAAYPVDYPRPEWAEQDPELWWQAVCRLGPQIMEDAGRPGITAGKDELAAISVSGQTPLCAPVDADWRPLRPAILWLDRRAGPQVAWLRERLGEERCRQVSANRLDSYFGGPKWLWFKQVEPALFERAWKILQANSYVILQLTGAAVIDPSQAGLCSPCFDAAAGQWDAAICAEMGLPLDRLPEIRPAWEVVGHVSAAAARASGLPEGTPVVCGGGDFACACLGAGVTGPESAALMLGTAGNLLFPGVTNRDPRLLHTIHLTGQPLPFGGVLAGGNLAWFAGLFGDPEPGLYARLDEEARAIPPGCEGLVYLPYLMGERTPIWDPEARGAFVGLSARHTRAHLYRAVLEGVAFAFRQIATIADVCDHGTPVVAIDGGARSPVWRAILASALGLPVAEGGSSSGTALGSAFLAALGTGGVSSFADIAAWTEIRSVTSSDPEVQGCYNSLYPIYAGLYEKLKPDFHRLAGG
jgi:xylulokinase